MPARESTTLTSDKPRCNDKTYASYLRVRMEVFRSEEDTCAKWNVGFGSDVRKEVGTSDEAA